MNAVLHSRGLCLFPAHIIRSTLAFGLSGLINLSLVISLAQLDAPDEPEDDPMAQRVRPSVVPPPPPPEPARSPAAQPPASATPFLPTPQTPALDLPALEGLSDGPGLGELGLDNLGFDAAWTIESRLPTPAAEPAPPTEPDQAPQITVVPDLARFYPHSARRRKLGGRSIVGVEVDARGRVQDAQVLESEPPGIFDDAALRAARSFTFEPARRGQEPVASNTRLELKWQPRR